MHKRPLTFIVPPYSQASVRVIHPSGSEERSILAAIAQREKDEALFKKGVEAAKTGDAEAAQKHFDGVSDITRLWNDTHKSLLAEARIATDKRLGKQIQDILDGKVESKNGQNPLFDLPNLLERISAPRHVPGFKDLSEKAMLAHDKACLSTAMEDFRKWQKDECTKDFREDCLFGASALLGKVSNLSRLGPNAQAFHANVLSACGTVTFEKAEKMYDEGANPFKVMGVLKQIKTPSHIPFFSAFRNEVQDSCDDRLLQAAEKMQKKGRSFMAGRLLGQIKDPTRLEGFDALGKEVLKGSDHLDYAGGLFALEKNHLAKAVGFFRAVKNRSSFPTLADSELDLDKKIVAEAMSASPETRRPAAHVVRVIENDLANRQAFEKKQYRTVTEAYYNAAKEAIYKDKDPVEAREYLSHVFNPTSFKDYKKVEKRISAYESYAAAKESLKPKNLVRSSLSFGKKVGQFFLLIHKDQDKKGLSIG